MIKIIIFLLFILVSKNSFSQNLSDNIIHDSIYPIIDTNYWIAKDIWLKLEKKYPIDSRNRLFFINYSFIKNDIKFFKNQLAFLVKNNGFEINEKLYWLNCYQEITTDGNLKKWYEKMYEKNYKNWVIHNLTKIETINLIDQLYTRDQLLSPMFSYTFDSCNILKNLNSKIRQENYLNLLKIVEISKREGELPNPYDFLPSTVGKIEIIIFHNLQDSINFEKKWNLLLPYIEKAYFDGKISDAYFKIYDKLSFNHFGYQYYGTLKDIPIKEIETYELRKKKYKL